MANLDGLEFRPAGSNEMAQFDLLASYVFASPRTDDSPPQLLQPEWTHCAFDGEQMAASSGGYPFIICMNGKKAAMQGVTAVGCEPTYRRRGIVRKLITDLLHRAKEEGQPGSILLASRGAIYQRFGYGHASNMVSYEFDPRRAAFQLEHPDDGYLKRLSYEEAKPVVMQVYKEYARPRSMLALRVEPVWERFIGDIAKNKAYCMAHFNKDNVPDGYAIYTTKWEDGNDDQEMVINDVAYTSISAYQAIWNNLVSHDLVGSVKWFLPPDDDPAPGLLLEPRCLKKKVGDGLWFRVVDVESMLASRGYDVDGDVTIAIDDDDLCPWNNGVYSISARDGTATVSKSSSGDADMHCSMNALASLISGYADATWMAQIGRLQFADQAKAGSITQLFKTQYKPALSFGF